MIPRIDAAALLDPADPGHGDMVEAVRKGATEIGFLTLWNTPLPASEVRFVIAAYRAFFDLPAEVKAEVDMVRTGSNRGWGAGGSEQVDPEANPDYKQVFDCGWEWPESGLPVYGANLWPERPAGFREVLQGYYARACAFSLDLLCAIAGAVGQDPGYFRDRFERPMALLRGNYYPSRPDWAGARDFGIATHTDYGCLTLLASDGVPGLEVRARGGGWLPVTAGPGEFVVNFGEMLQMWTDGQIVATPHRVVGGSDERLSVPLFFNPSFDTNVAPKGAAPIRAVDHLSKRFDETYLHLKNHR